jgi:dCTP deaminase
MGVAVQNTVIEPGWCGYLTLELTNNTDTAITLEKGQPIAQILFELLDEPTEMAYQGKYQNQPNRPVAAIKEAK